MNRLEDTDTKAWSGRNDKLAVRGRWTRYAQQREGKKESVRLWQQSSNLETLGGRERSLRGLYVGAPAREGDHRPVAAHWQEPPHGRKDTWDFSCLLLPVSDLRVCTPTVHSQTRTGGSLLHIIVSESRISVCASTYRDHISWNFPSYPTLLLFMIFLFFFI